MKSSALLAVRVEPALRQELESVLTEHETISSFVEQAVRSAVSYRRAQSDFLARGEQASQTYLQTGASIPADEVFARLENRIKAHRQELLKKP